MKFKIGDRVTATKDYMISKLNWEGNISEVQEMSEILINVYVNFDLYTFSSLCIHPNDLKLIEIPIENTKKEISSWGF